MDITKTCKHALMKAVLAVAPIASICDAINIHPDRHELKVAQEVVQKVGSGIADSQKRKNELEATLEASMMKRGASFRRIE
jgi:hypothetical protein